MMPAASSLRDFLVAEGRRFWPNLNMAGEGKRLRREAITLPRGSDDNFRFSGEGLPGIRVPGAFSAACSLHWKRKVSWHPLTGAFAHCY
jgi:hypothetical protein